MIQNYNFHTETGIPSVHHITVFLGEEFPQSLDGKLNFDFQRWHWRSIINQRRFKFYSIPYECNGISNDELLNL